MAADPQTILDPATVRGLRRRVLAHYDRSRRDLPWRGLEDPYAIWVSEVMLQQTRVETVRSRWGRFLERFPDVRTLAAASEHHVLHEWEGLGYYGRARSLHRAARVLVERHGARLPDTPEALRALPGFGPYTAAAVASIAFRRRVAVVDGNVVRVLSRLLAIGEPVGGAAARTRIEAAADLLLSPGRPGDWNQAVMDLGATVCTPRRPACLLCPLAPDCLARRRGDPEAFPARAARRPLPHVEVAAGLVWKGDRLLIARRPSRGLLGGLFEFPGGKREPGESLEEACVREVEEETGLVVRCEAPFLSIDHAYTHFRVTLHLFHCRVLRGRLEARRCEEPRFVPVGDLAAYPFPRANRRALEALGRGEGGPRPARPARVARRRAAAR